MLEIETHEHDCYGMQVDLERKRIVVEFDNGAVDGRTCLDFETLQRAGFTAPNVEAYRNAQAMAVVERFVKEWNDTWTDPDEVSHEWADLYQMAKAVLESR